MSDLSQLGIADIRQGLVAKQFSCEELVRFLAARVNTKSDLNCFLEFPEDEILQQARAADSRIAGGDKAPLLGVPIAVKDAILTKNLKSTSASKILGDFKPPYDATVVAKLRAAGAIIFGKTNMDEFAMGSSNENSAFGPVKNPWDNSRVPGGSSGGSAAAVAARLCPGALGTDTGGSVRQPASLCGLVGIKPTYGRVSRLGVIAFASSLDQVGTFARSAQDCALLTSAICGHDPFDSTSVDLEVPKFDESIGKEIKGLRVGIPREYFVDGMSKEVESAVRSAISQLEKLGAQAVEISLPHTEAAVAVYYILAPAEASSNLARYDGIRYGYRCKNPEDLKDLYFRSRSEGFGKEVKRRIMIGAYVLSTGYYDAYYLRAQKVRTLIKRDFDQAFEKECDLIACPVAPTTAFKIGEKSSDPLAMYLSDIFTIPVNLAGLPGMSLPCGFDSAGLPIGLQLIAKPWNEEAIFRAAAAYQGATEWHKKFASV